MAHNDNFTMGAQGQFIRFQHAQWALVKIPGKPEDYSEGMLKSLLTLSDVMATGYHAARAARVQPGDTVIVLGDGAVGQCGIIAAKMMGAKRIISTAATRTAVRSPRSSARPTTWPSAATKAWRSC